MVKGFARFPSQLASFLPMQRDVALYSSLSCSTPYSTCPHQPSAPGLMGAFFKLPVWLVVSYVWNCVGHRCVENRRARIFHESLAATTDMVVLPGVLGCRALRRTVQVRLGPIPRYAGRVARYAAQAPALRVARPSSWSRDSNS